MREGSLCPCYGLKNVMKRELTFVMSPERCEYRREDRVRDSYRESVIRERESKEIGGRDGKNGNAERERGWGVEVG